MEGEVGWVTVWNGGKTLQIWYKVDKSKCKQIITVSIILEKRNNAFILPFYNNLHNEKPGVHIISKLE